VNEAMAIFSRTNLALGLVVLIGVLLLTANWIMCFIWFAAVIWGTLIQKYTLDVFGVASMDNMFGGKKALEVELSKSHRATFKIIDLKNPLVQDRDHKAYLPSEKDFFYKGNLPLIIQPEEEAFAFNPYNEEEINVPVSMPAKCPKCNTEMQAQGDVAMRLPVQTKLSSERLDSFFWRLTDWLIATAVTEARTFIIIIMGLAALCAVLLIYQTFVGIPGIGSSVNANTGAQVAAAIQTLNHTNVIIASNVKPA
jgi:hypothetical protein